MKKLIGILTMAARALAACSGGGGGGRSLGSMAGEEVDFGDRLAVDDGSYLTFTDPVVNKNEKAIEITLTYENESDELQQAPQVEILCGDAPQGGGVSLSFCQGGQAASRSGVGAGGW